MQEPEILFSERKRHTFQKITCMPSVCAKKVLLIQTVHSGCENSTLTPTTTSFVFVAGALGDFFDFVTKTEDLNDIRRSKSEHS